jgi:hypothetical protein
MRSDPVRQPPPVRAGGPLRVPYAGSTPIDLELELASLAGPCWYAYNEHKLVAIVLAGIALRIGMPLGVVLATAAFVAGYGGLLHADFRLRQKGPPTIRRHLPPIRCRELPELADQAVEQDARGHTGAALDGYLRVLARHPVNACRHLVAVHAADAALALGRPRATLDLTAAMLGEGSDPLDPPSAGTRLRVAARVLRARAPALTGGHQRRAERAAVCRGDLRQATTHQGRRAPRAPEILARAGELTTQDDFIEGWSSASSPGCRARRCACHCSTTGGRCSTTATRPRLERASRRRSL